MRCAICAVVVAIAVCPASSTAGDLELSVGVGLGVAATAGDGAVRGEPYQAEPLPPPPRYLGCLPPGLATTTSGVDTRQWVAGWIFGKRRVALYAPAGERGPVALIGDSNTLLSLDLTMESLISAGFGPICIDAAYGRTVTLGTGSSPVRSGEEVIAFVRASDPVWGHPAVRWVVALGTNDVLYVAGSRITAFATRQFASVEMAAGSPPLLWWVDLRTTRAGTVGHEARWNALLGELGRGRVEWAALTAADPNRYVADDDHVHVTPEGAALRAQLVVAALSA